MDNTVYPAPYVINDTDKAGLITVVTTFCLVCIWIMFVIRIYIRLKINGPWKWDDTLVAIATVLSCARSVVVYVEVQRGYGKSEAILGDLADVEIGKAILGDNILYFLAMFCSKCAVLLLCLRMTPKREHRIALGAVFLLSALWAFSSILMITVNCKPAHPWVDLAGQCAHSASRWKAVSALDIITEAAIFGCSIYLVAGLHMTLLLKAIVVVAFGIRLPTIIFSAIRLHAVLAEISSADPTLMGAYTAAWTQVEVDFALCACTFSSLGAFLKPFDNEVGPSRTDSRNVYNVGSQQSYPMGSLGSGKHATSTHVRRTTSSEGDLPILRKDATPNVAVITYNGTADDRISVGTNDSKKGIIVKQVQWTVENGRKSDEEQAKTRQ